MFFFLQNNKNTYILGSYTLFPPGSNAVLPLQLLRQGILVQEQSERPRVQEPQSLCGADLLALANILVYWASGPPSPQSTIL